MAANWKPSKSLQDAQRTIPPPGGFPEGVAIAGVQCGKSSIAGALIGSAALTGEPGTVAVGVAQDQRGSMR
ncbi:MAG: hypothetical protein KF751_06750, partial [Nitrospira sp.]|nr:hypothetical protein [Nitrospira sp.]